MRRIFPAADAFASFADMPPAAPAYRDGRLVGYVFFTAEVTESLGYAGRPLNLAVGLGLDGRITGVEVVEHNEPILLIGVAEADLAAFAARYRGVDVRRPLAVVRRGGGPDAVDAVAGATVSSIVMNEVILRSARIVARSRGLLGAAGARIALDRHEPADWPTLLADGSLARLALDVAAVERALAGEGARRFPPGATPPPEATFVDLYVGLATPARIGRNLLGDAAYHRLVASLAEGDHAIFVGGRGLYSFKGTAYRQAGRFTRLQLVQGERTFTFAADDHRRVDKLAAVGAPELRELGLFVLHGDSGFSAAEPWRLELLVDGERESGGEAVAVFRADYALPSLYRVAETADADEAPPPLWQAIWVGRLGEVTVLVALLLGLTVLLVSQEVLTRRRELHRRVRTAFLVVTLLWVGWSVGAQLSVVQVVTFAEALRTEFRWELFLIDPMLFVLWSFVAAAMLFWGRGVFCGWLCPFGALQELLGRAAERLRIPQLHLPYALHERLAAIKYVVFLVIIALSLGPMAIAHRAAEVEPFKTVIVLHGNRAWPFVAYALAVLLGALFVRRAFCRYLCPLGAALALPARLRTFDWLKRRWQCGQQCHICAVQCPVQAINPEGRINPNECHYCLGCQVNHSDDRVCPPLIERRRRREQRAQRPAATKGGDA